MKQKKKMIKKKMAILAGILMMNIAAIGRGPDTMVTVEAKSVQNISEDSHKDDPVAGKMDKDDFDSLAEWEAYLKKHPEEQAQENSGIAPRLGPGTGLSGPSIRIPKLHVKAAASLKYTITNLPLKTAIQKCYIGSDAVYVTQRTGSNTYLSRCTIAEDGVTAVCQDRMILQNFGHGQTLEGYEYNGEMCFWISCKANTAYAERWSMQIGRLQYEPGKTISNYTKICRMANLNYANKGMKSFGSVKRVDAALSEDGSKLMLWVQNIYNGIQYSCYDASVLNRLLDEKETDSSKYITFENNAILKAACFTSFEQIQAEERILPNGSFQGIECGNDMSIYVCGGKAGEVPGIVIMSKNSGGYQYSSLVTLESPDFNSQSEIEGIQLNGDFVYFGICSHDVKAKEQYIYSVSRSSVSTAAKGHQNIGIRNVKEPTCTATGYSGDVYCEDCGEKLGTGRLILANGHKWDAGKVTKKQTAIQNGTKTYTCTVCQEKRTETIPANGVPKKGALLKSGKVSYLVTKSGSENGTVRYVKNAAGASSVKIPATVRIDGIIYKVTSVGANAFKNNKKVTKIVIGSNVTSIGQNAFSGCTKLKTITLGSQVTVLGNRAFFQCTKLTKLTIPAKVNRMGTKIFYGCKALKNITIKTTKLTDKKVGSKAFRGIAKKALIKVPKKKRAAYKKLLKKKGIGSRVTVQ